MGDGRIDNLVDLVDLGISGLEGGKLIGSGASARVYRSRQLAVDRPVAVKILGTRDPELLRRFRREARALGRLSRQPGIVTIYDYGETDSGQPYLALELCTRSLRDRIVEDGKLDPEATLGAALEIARALAAAHKAGVIHRDIKPGNILIDRHDRYLISDFGISTLADTSSSHSDQVGFTAGYAAPEVFDGETKPGTAADIYALGATMVHMLTGRPPFFASSGEGLLAVVARIAGEPPPDLTSKGVPDDLNALIGRTLAKSPTDRQTIDEVIGELTAMVSATAQPEAARQPLVVEATPCDPLSAALPDEHEATREPNTEPTIDPAPVAGTGDRRRLALPSVRSSLPAIALIAVVVMTAWWFVGRPDESAPTLEHGATDPEAADAGPVDGDASPGAQQGDGGDEGANRGDAPRSGPAGAEPDSEADAAGPGIEGEADDGTVPTDATPLTTPNGSTITTSNAPTTTTATTARSSSIATTTSVSSTTSQTGSTQPSVSTTTTTTTTTSTTQSTVTTPTTPSTVTTPTTISTITPPTTVKGALIITGIDGPTEVPCGVGTRIYTAVTNGVEVTSWAWSSPLRTLSPINQGPDLRVEFVMAQPGTIRIRIRANDGEASAFIDVEVLDGVNC